MVKKRLEPVMLVVKAVEFASAAVAIEYVWDVAEQQPINEGEHRQAQTVGPKCQDNADRHDGASDELIEILGEIKLPAGTDRTAVKEVRRILDLADRLITFRTDDVLLSVPRNLDKFLTGRTIAGQEALHSVIPNLIRKYL